MLIIKKSGEPKFHVLTVNFLYIKIDAFSI